MKIASIRSESIAFVECSLFLKPSFFLSKYGLLNEKRRNT